MKFLFSLLFLIAFNQLTYAQSYQDSVLLFNGKFYKCNVIGIEASALRFDVLSKKGKIIDYQIPSHKVISYTKNTETTILYKKIVEVGNVLELYEAKNYAIGGYDARHTFNSKPVFWTSFGIGLGMSIWDTYLTPKAFDPVLFPELNAGFFGKGPTMVPFLAPLLLSATFGLPNLRIRDKHMLHKNMKNDNMYYNGFNNYVKQKKTFASLKGSAIGIGVGLLAYSIFKIN